MPLVPALPGSRALAAPTRKALVKLLAACGVASSGWEEGDGAGGGEGAEGDGGGGPLSLAAFLPEAVEELRKVPKPHPYCVSWGSYACGDLQAALVVIMLVASECAVRLCCPGHCSR